MRLRNLKNYISLAVVVPMFAALVFIYTGCAASRQSMISGSAVPASQGTVSTTSTDNGNTKVGIKVKNLAAPSMVASDATVYVVWIKPRNGKAQNVGAMIMNEKLEGSLDTVTSHSRFQIIITPEASGQTIQPSHDPVFTSNIEPK